jgi:hypothetical protein
MARTLSNVGLVLSPHGLLVIHPPAFMAEAELRRLFPRLAALTPGQRVHVSSPHCTVDKDADEGTDLFIIEACGACPTAVT